MKAEKHLLFKQLILFFIISIFCAFPVCAQDSAAIVKSKLHFEISEHIGKAIANQPSFPPVHAAQFTEFSLLRECNGAELWHQHYNYPVTGATFIFGTLGNPNVLGNVAAALASIQFDGKKEKRFRFRQKIAFGMAYFTQPFDAQSNNSNIVIGSRFTAIATLNLACNYTISNRFALHLGSTYLHASNAHYQLPNLGLNALFMNLGISYFPHGANKNYFKASSLERNKKFHLNVKVGLGINERGGTLGPTNGPKYPIYLASVFLTKRYANKALLQIGVEGNYNSGAHDFIVSNDVFSSKEKLKSTTSIFFLGHEYLWKHLSFVLQGGVYLYNPLYREVLQSQKDISTKEHLKSWFTTKFGFQYYLFDTYRKFNNQIYIGSYVKANLGQADYWETSLGYCF